MVWLSNVILIYMIQSNVFYDQKSNVREVQMPFSFVAKRQLYPSFYPRKKRVFVTSDALLVRKYVRLGL